MIAHGARILVIYGEKSMNSSDTKRPRLILASSSVFRKKQLQSLGLRFDCISPDIDEQLQPGETAEQATLRLAQGKARAVARNHTQACVIGSDQLCALESGELVGKPGDVASAQRQLRRLSGQTVHFVTALCVQQGEHHSQRVCTTEVRFRTLSAAEIAAYLEREPDAVYCAGSFMSESLGISLCASIRSDDPSALIGLPLIACCELLREFAYALP